MKTVLITGAGRGIGFHLAHRMTKLGWNVISTVHTIGHTQGTLPGTVIEMDIADAGSVRSAARRVAELDVLINNAIFSVPPTDTNILTVPLDLVLKSLEVNTVGPLRVAQAFVPALLRSKAGRIVNVSSIRGQLTGQADRPPMIDPPGYSISKTGLNMITGLLSSALRSKGISVNSVCPSGTGTMETAIEEIVWVATELGHDQTGKFFHCRQEIAW